MKVILIGYPGSQKIVPASKYLARKYTMGLEFDYVNYGGRIEHWGSFVSGYLTALYRDPYIIFALDDYLLSGFDWDKFYDASLELYGNVVCIKLCNSTEQEHLEYPVTTQYTIWDRKYLISLLLKVSTPWSFEINGSAIFRSEGMICLHRPCLEYFTNSSISSRWEGVRLDGLKEEDKKYILENGLIK